MIHRKQIIVISSVAVLMVILLSLDIKGLIKPKEQRNVASGEMSQPASAATLESVSINAKQALNANLTQQVSELEEKLRNASSEEKINVERELAQKWDDVNQPGPEAFYLESIASKEASYQNWLKAGDSFTSAYEATQDSTFMLSFVQKAINAYQEALKFDPNGLDAKTGLGSAYVSGTANPMQGISLLLEVVKQDPKNIKANMNLGLFSMKSGQYEKAVSRFKTVTTQISNPEAWFYLASSYENLGMNNDAITAYLKSKELAADPGLGNFVDKKVQELKK